MNRLVGLAVLLWWAAVVFCDAIIVASLVRHHEACLRIARNAAIAAGMD